MNILGINAYHGDSSAALVIDGQLVVAVEEERFTRIKHWAGFPAESIRYCMEMGGVKPEELDHVAVSFDPKANIGKKALFALKNRPSFKSILDRLQRQGKSISLRKELAKALGAKPEEIQAKIHHVEHHDAHIASGFFLSPFQEAAILSIDGMGDFVSTVTASGNGTDYKKIDQVYYPHSLGFLYEAVTIYLGFPRYGDEYKVMGLAPYGKPEFVDVFRDIIRPKGSTFELNLDYFTHPATGVSLSWDNGSPHCDPFHSELLVEKLGPSRDPDEPVTPHHEAIAHSMQRVTEEIILHLLNHLQEQTGQTNVVLVGGCAMNSVANGKITTQTKFTDVFVPAGAADNGGSFGAAFHVWHQILGEPRSFQLKHAMWGDDVKDEQCRQALEQADLPAGEFQFEQMPMEQVMELTVDAICDGKVVGWFQGRMEFGARALGSRSLLADPRRTDMRDIINLKIKFREKFRPFAPSILEEHVADYFEIDEPSPFMERVFPIKPEMRQAIPAVTHVDGSGRLQTVSREFSPRYWELIDKFRQRTGVPILLNTSLNENEPIVRTPAEAISCFQRTAMDMLVLGSYVLRRVNSQ
ncbi:MAG: carbamoyltransferase [Pirellulales bacterium]|nr:carbamoyltransferase [Pirellulales bacterium]